MRPTKLEKQHMDRVARIPCLVCSDWPVAVHHAKTGAGGRKNHMLVLPLCYTHHQGREGIHTLGRKAWQAMFGTEDEMLERVKKLLDYEPWM